MLFIAVSGAAIYAQVPDCAGVRTDSGAVTGRVIEKAKVCEFEGIPYAAPPVGELRFAPPQPPAPWEDTIEAFEYGNICVQYPLMSMVTGGGEVIGSEDCLYLNVWQPFSKDGAKKPVMVFIHGGGFISGSGGADLIEYNGTKLAAKGGVVVVTFNYRLGVFGFFSHPALEATGGRGNYGMLDQTLALKWVKNNIANFGGDPNNITVFGESAGGMSVGIHVLSPLSAGLFHRAIIESGPMTYIGRTFDDADADGLAIAAMLGCDESTNVLECLRAVDAVVFQETARPAMHIGKSDGDGEKLGAKTDSFGFGPTIGGPLIPEPPLRMLAEGIYNKNVQDIIVGSNKDETSYFTLGRKVDTPENFDKELAKNIEEIKNDFGLAGDPEKIKELYPLENYDSPRKAYNEIVGDMGFTCPSLLMATLLSKAGANTYLYNFAKAPDEKGMAKDWGAFHGSELAFIFGQFKVLNFNFKSKKNYKVAKDMILLWSSFARSGVPAAAGVPHWPAFTLPEGSYLRIDVESEVLTNYKPAKCGYFESLMTNSNEQ